ncbi:erythromycin esterase family protein [Actinokineospora sp. UTMC 2448]|uniref:erythromycin esterase family protein n=1 Tax=Actinokineospora sp. UTMC 2448 TaxID=2268449 RepID=UPI002164EEC3|nr:erythromycin esterase family protein [Actinokineospora sp. UTMC 2448]UVS77359.1 Putative phosphoribosyl transferasec [Actinokineospora sp. UTMC 2448]
MADRLFRDRQDAGRVLAGLLAHYRDRGDVLVLGLPRGGVPVAYEVATALGAPLDVFLVRKLGLPQHRELAMGALASGGVMVLNDDVVRGYRVPADVVRRVADEESRELRRRERAYRGDRPPLRVEGRTVILVDDGLATGASMRAAVRALRELGPGRLVVAVPTASASTCEEFGREVDEVVCATTPSPFHAVGQSYWDFAQTDDREVTDLLRAAPAPTVRDETDVDVVRACAIPVEGGVPADDVLFDLVGDARFVLIGEASHGTHEFYGARARMTRRLIEERGFHAVAVEADWPDAYRVNRWVRGHGEDRDAVEALGGFERFPAWMWRNTEVVEFLTWLRGHNERRDQVGFYGLDLYSLHRSAEQVIAYLEGVDPEAAARARDRYSCLDHSDDGQGFGLAAAFGAGEDCEGRILDQLLDLQRHADRDGLLAEDERFHAERNAHVVQSAERYYRTMFGGRVSSWNLRDEHMGDTLDALAEHIGVTAGEPAKIVVWAHNSHLGDARATEMSLRGEFNLGQLVRERHPDDCRLIGFTTYTGTVTAADDWGGPADRKRVRPALDDSVERLFHDTGLVEFMLDFTKPGRAADILESARLERAIGVIYRPGTERQSHYFRTRLPRQFDAVIHVDETRALQPLERTARWEAGELPESYPHAV